MSTFICINDLPSNKGRPFNSKRFIEKKSIDNKISGIFFYSNSVITLADRNSSDRWINYSQKQNIPIYACRNSLISRNILKKVNPLIQVSGLGKLLEGVITSKKTLVIGKI